MSDEITPAMTAEQWAECEEDEISLAERIRWAVDELGLSGSATRHSLAALCLHGQPFGFTHEDADAIKALMPVGWDRTVTRAEDAEVDRETSQRDRVVAKIRALLPPV